MNTTAIFIEVLIIGIQGFVWILLALLGINVIHIKSINFETLKDCPTIIIPLFFSFCYTVGIIIDRVADGLCIFFSPERNLFRISFFKRLKNKAISGNNNLTILKIQIKEDKLSEYFSYIKSRLRILRGTTLNIFLITIFSVVYFLSKEASVFSISKQILYSVGISFLGFAITFISWISLALLEFTFIQRQAEIKNII